MIPKTLSRLARLAVVFFDLIARGPALWAWSLYVRFTPRPEVISFTLQRMEALGIVPALEAEPEPESEAPPPSTRSIEVAPPFPFTRLEDYEKPN